MFSKIKLKIKYYFSIHRRSIFKSNEYLKKNYILVFFFKEIVDKTGCAFRTETTGNGLDPEIQ